MRSHAVSFDPETWAVIFGGGIEMDEFWHKAWQFALHFAVIAMLAASIIIQGQTVTADEVRDIVPREREEEAALSARRWTLRRPRPGVVAQTCAACMGLTARVWTVWSRRWSTTLSSSA